MASWPGVNSWVTGSWHPQEDKARGGPLSAQTWESRKLCFLHSWVTWATLCDVIGQGRSHTEVKVEWWNQEPFSLILELCPACSLESSLHPSRCGYPKQTISPHSPTTLSTQPLLVTLQERRRSCPQGTCNLVGETAISFKKSAAILPLWVPTAFRLFTSNNKKHKVQENGFHLECGWESRGENWE